MLLLKILLFVNIIGDTERYFLISVIMMIGVIDHSVCQISSELDSDCSTETQGNLADSPLVFHFFFQFRYGTLNRCHSIRSVAGRNCWYSRSMAADRASPAGWEAMRTSLLRTMDLPLGSAFYIRTLSANDRGLEKYVPGV